MKTFIYTALALTAFAANSVLCRFALGNATIDAASFTVIRLFSGALILLLILKVKTKSSKASSKTRGSWLSSSMLFLYAVSFSFAYIPLDTGTGALILFGAVQITIIAHSIISGNRLHALEWLGAIVAFLGFVYLMLPGVSSPSLIGFTLMAIAGVAWGVYTVRGKTSENVLATTAYNFIKTIPFVVILLIFTIKNAHFSTEGVLLAMVSGGITSGIGYTIWYLAIRGLTSVQTAVVQLLVPIIAAFGGVLFISEVITLRLKLSSAMVLGGILIVVLSKKQFTK